MKTGICFERLYREDLRRHRLVSSLDFDKGSMVARFQAGAELDAPTWLTVQVAEELHILLAPELLSSLNHSCDPNVFVDTQGMRVVALRPIAEGEELTYFYPSTEWDMAEPFDCSCQACSCLGRIEGASHVPLDVLARYRLNPHIVRLIGARAASGPLRGIG
jgi:SET domain